MNDRSGDFSMALGGPLYQLYIRSGLARPPLDLLARRLVAIPLFAWLPLALLSLWGGAAFGGVEVPFLKDIEAHVRFLIALPLFIVAEPIVHVRLRAVIAHFTEAGIVPASERGAFDRILESAIRWRNSIAVELALVALALTVGRSAWLAEGALKTATWYAHPGAGGVELTAAGQWYTWVSVPFFQFITFRWFYRMLVWFGALLRISRMDLRLVPTHADRSGGLGFLGTTVEAFAPLVSAQGALVAGLIASQVFYGGKAVMDFKIEMIGALVLAMAQVLLPLCVFLPRLAKCRRDGLHAYGRLCSEYVDRFDRKWIRGQGREGQDLLGHGDIGALADIGSAYDAVRGMRSFPFGRKEVVQLAVAAMLPVAPLFLTMMSPAELLKKIMGFLM